MSEHSRDVLEIIAMLKSNICTEICTAKWILPYVSLRRGRSYCNIYIGIGNEFK